MLRPLITTVIVAAALAGCNGEESPPTPFIGASVAGTAWVRPASEGQVVYTVDAPDGPGTVYSIASRSFGSSREYLAIDLPNPPRLGTFSLGGDTAFATYAICTGAAAAPCSSWRAIASDPGTLTITAIDTSAGTIAGSFAFHGHLGGESAGDVKNVTAGRFLIHFAPPPA